MTKKSLSVGLLGWGLSCWGRTGCASETSEVTIRGWLCNVKKDVILKEILRACSLKITFLKGVQSLTRQST